MPKSKVSAFFSVLLVFASGVAMGGVGYRLYVVKTVASPVQAATKKKMSPEESRKRLLTHLNDAIKLNPQQLEEVKKIYDWQGDQFKPIQKKYQAKIDQDWQEFDQQLHQLHEAAVAKMKAILTPEQQPLYAKYLADRAAKHQQEQQQHGPGQGPHNDGHRPLPPLPLP